MMNWKKYMGIVVQGLVIFFLAGWLGFNSGFFYGQGMAAAEAGPSIVLVLRHLHGGRVQEGIKSLEKHLDANVILFAQYTRNFQLFDLARLGNLNSKKPWLKVIADYRQEHPSEIDDSFSRNHV